MDIQNCRICGEDSFPPSLLRLHEMLERNFIQQMKEKHPEWFRKNQQKRVYEEKVYEEYRLRHKQYKDEARNIRLSLKSTNQLAPSSGEADSEEESY